MQYSIVYYIAGCVGVTRSLLWDKSCQLENYTFWGSVKNTSECAAAWGAWPEPTYLWQPLHNCCLYFGLSACKMRNSNANVQRN